MSNRICKCGHSEDKHHGLIHKHNDDLACFHRVGDEGDETWYCPCMVFEEDVVVSTQDDLKAVEANYDALQSPMPCGHLARYAVNEKEGTQYCAICNGDALFEAGKEALAYINRMNEFARACIRYAGNSGDTYLADKAREALGENNNE